MICEQGHPAPENAASSGGMARLHPPGLSVAVAINGEVVWAEGFGLADVEQTVPVTNTSKFRIGSTSKSFTAVAALLLSERGKLDLDTDVRRYVPAFPDKGYVITTRELLMHRGGVRHYSAKELDQENQRHYSSVTEGLERFKNDPLISPPGAQWHYSSYGYNLVGAIIEGAAGKKFLEFMQDEVFHPLVSRI
jgi:serine beta-lactamase-like protein LACTB